MEMILSIYEIFSILVMITSIYEICGIFLPSSSYPVHVETGFVALISGMHGILVFSCLATSRLCGDSVVNVISDMHGIFSICLSSYSYLVRVETEFVALILVFLGYPVFVCLTASNFCGDRVYGCDLGYARDIQYLFIQL